MGLKSGSKSGKGGKSNGKLNSGRFQQLNTQNDSGSEEEPQIDSSVLRPSIEISVKGFTDLIKMFNSGSAEIKNLLAHQCDLIYECKVCKNLFRSVANFVSHKRVYCRKEYCAAAHTRNRNDVVEDYTWVIQPEPAPAGSPEARDWMTSDDSAAVVDVPSAHINTAIPPISTYSKPKKDLSKIVEKLGKKSSIQTVTETVGHLSATHLYEDISQTLIARNNDRKEHAFQLESMEGTKIGVFQTKLCTTTTTTTSTIQAENTDLMKAQISELQNIESNNEATLGPNGQIVMVNGHSSWTVASDKDTVSSEQTDAVPGLGNAKEEHVCQQCNQKFSTRKTLSHHIKSLHVMFRMCYPCPCCKSIFVNTWSVYRHLYKVHRKTTAQVRKLRPQIQKKAFRKDKSEVLLSPAPGNIKNATLKELQRLDQDWMDNFEDDLELQRCGGCGRRFERRAALNSHSQICQKRIAARNNVKSHRGPASMSSGATAVDKVIKQSLAPQSESEPVDIILENTKKCESVVFPSSNKGSTSSVQADNSSSSSTGSPYSRVQQGSSGSWSEQTKKDIPEKRIEIQIRRDYCKIGSGGSGVLFASDVHSELDSRPQLFTTGEEGENYDENMVRDWEAGIQPQDAIKVESELVYTQGQTNTEEQHSIISNCGTQEEMNVCNNLAKDVGENNEVIARTNCKTDENGESCDNVKVEYKRLDTENEHFPFYITCPDEVNNTGTSKELNTSLTESSAELNTYSTLSGNENGPAVSLPGVVVLANVQAKVRNKRKRPASAVLRHPNAAEGQQVQNKDTKVIDAPNQKAVKVKVSVAKKPKKVEPLSPVMESRMQALINVRRLQCLTCQKKFNKLTNLRRHVAIHIGWSRYRCIVCHYKCFSKYDCVAHVCKVHLKSGLRSKAITMVQYIEAQAEESEATIQSQMQLGYTPVVPTEKLNTQGNTKNSRLVKFSLKSKNINTTPLSITELANSLVENPGSSGCNVIVAKETKATIQSPIQLGYTPVVTTAKINTQENTKKSQLVKISLESKNMNTTPLSITGLAGCVVEKPSSSDCEVVLEPNVVLEDTQPEDPLLPCPNGNVTEEVLSNGLQTCVNKPEEQGDGVAVFVQEQIALPSTSVGVKSDSVDLNEDKKRSASPLEALSNGELKEDGEGKAIGGDKLGIEDICPVTDETYVLRRNEMDLTSRQNDPSALQKMVMEVIFGSNSDANPDFNQTLFSDLSNGVYRDDLSSRASSAASELETLLERNCDSPASMGMSTSPSEYLSTVRSTKSTNILPVKPEVPPVESTRRERPVRNRVRVAREDFIYDLSDACLNPKKETDHSVTKTVAKRKQYDTMKEILKQGGLEHTSIANNFEVLKCVPKLMLVRTDGGETSAGKRINIATKGTWSTTYSSTSSESNSEKDTVVNSPQTSVEYNRSTRKSQRVFDTKPV